MNTDTKQETLYTKDTESYNEKRYSKPWIARVISWEAESSYPVLKFGAFIGDHGYSGNVEILAKPGDVLKVGQKDYRGNNTENEFYIAKEDGGLERLTTGQARKAFLESSIII